MKKGVKIFDKKGKKAQQIMGLSFGVIFSIILIVFFIVIAGIVINSFLKTGKCVKLGQFVDRFDKKIEEAWNSQGITTGFNGNLPSQIKYVCIFNLSDSTRGDFQEIGGDLEIYFGRNVNTFLYPLEEACQIPVHNIKHLDINKITTNNNPNCFAIRKGKFSVEIEKGLNDRFVTVK